MNPMSLNLRAVGKFFIVQADGFEEWPSTIKEEKEFDNLQDALKMMEQSQALVKYLKFNYEGSVYKLYPTPETGEFRVVKQPIVN